MSDYNGDGRAAGSILVLHAVVRALIQGHPRRAEILNAARAARDSAQNLMEESIQSGDVDRTLFTLDFSNGAEEALEMLFGD